jgi:hypothetical protein
MLVDHLIASIQAPAVGRTAHSCEICGEMIPSELRQNHMGCHILRKLRGITERSGENLENVCPVSS